MPKPAPDLHPTSYERLRRAKVRLVWAICIFAPSVALTTQSTEPWVRAVSYLMVVASTIFIIAASAEISTSKGLIRELHEPQKFGVSDEEFEQFLKNPEDYKKNQDT